MKCSDLDELLSAYANDELSRTQREFMEEHLSSCADCQAALADYMEVRQRLMSLKAMRPMLDLGESIMSKVRAARSAPSPNERERIPKRVDTEEQPVAASWGPLRTKLKAMKDTVAGILFLKWPIWKTALASGLVMAVVAGLSITIPSIARQTDEALVKEIALKSSVVLEATGGKEITEANSEFNIVYIENNTARVEIYSKSLSTLVTNTTMRSWRVSLELDLVSKRVTHYFYQRDNVTDEEAEQVLSILKADSRTGALLDQGAVISYTGNFSRVTGWGHVGATSEIRMAEEKQLTVDLDLGDEYYELYVARVDLIRGEVSAFGELRFGLMSDEEIEEIVNILKSDSQVKELLDKGAVIRGMSKYMVSSTVVKEGEGTAELTAARIMVHMELDGKQYGADVDVIRGEVLRFGENLEYISSQSP